LLDEIRALSEMEAGRRLLQIVLVGQPDLRSRLRRPEMQKIAQRVTTVCEVRPMSREAVAGYVSHRLAAVGGARDRVEFSEQALDFVFNGSAGIPRLVNRICDRALLYGYVDRTSQIGLAHVGRALHDLELAPSRDDLRRAPPVATVAPLESAAPAVETASAGDTPGGLFVKTAGDQSVSSAGLDLTALLSLPAVTRRTTESAASARVDRPTMTSRRSTKRSAWWRRALKSLSLPALGMGVMLFAGSIAVSTAGRGSLRSDLPPLPASALVYPASVSRPVAVSSTARGGKTVPAQKAAAAAGSSEQTWIVQVAAFASQARSTTTVQHLTNQGLPAYQVDPDDMTSGLTIVRVGPFRSAREADDVRDLLREMPDYEGAFVRNITTP
jgi:hypothetical protein